MVFPGMSPRRIDQTFAAASLGRLLFAVGKFGIRWCRVPGTVNVILVGIHIQPAGNCPVANRVVDLRK